MSNRSLIHKALSVPRRRGICRFVAASTDDAVSLEEITTYLATEERIEQGSSVANEEKQKQIRLELHHNHLPMLAEAGILEYDPKLNMVRTDSELPSTADLLESTSTHTREMLSQ